MRRKHNSITTFNGNQRLIYCGRNRICCRWKGNQDTQWHTDIHHFFLFVTLNHTYATHAFQVFRKIFTHKAIFNKLILPIAVISFINRLHCQIFCVHRNDVCHAVDNFIQLFLAKSSQMPLRFSCIFSQNSCFLHRE